jgi:hypothetical protein
VSCRKCGATAFKTDWQTFADGTKHVRMSCSKFGTFARYLPQTAEGKPVYQHEPRAADVSAGASVTPPRGWRWLGYVRGDGGEWHQVAECATREACWSALMTTWQGGDKLIVPVCPQGEGDRPGAGPPPRRARPREDG